MSRDYLTRRETLRRGTAAVAALSLGGAATTTVTADEHGSGLFGRGAVAEPGPLEQALLAIDFAQGLATRGLATATDQLSDDQTKTLDDHVTAAVGEFETHSEDWRAYANDRGLGGESHQSLQLTWEYDGSTTERYVLATWDGDAEEYSTVDVTTEFGNTPDHSATLSGKAVENAAYELETLHERYIEPNEPVDPGYLANLRGQYSGDHITASFL